jgi:lipopolysaccharide transport system ATP-binding protein
MYLRLAFSIAAHFEPEVLLMDEIIAVGDINFQEKCFAKMRAVSREGRTVFLVSHNLDSIQKLCKRVLLLQSGRLSEEQDAQKVIELYVSDKDKGAAESR